MEAGALPRARTDTGLRRTDFPVFFLRQITEEPPKYAEQRCSSVAQRISAANARFDLVVAAGHAAFVRVR